MRERTEVVSGRFTPRERKLVKEQARDSKMSESEYVRAAVMTMLVFEGNVEAMKITAELARAKFGAWKAATFRGEPVRA